MGSLNFKVRRKAKREEDDHTVRVVVTLKIPAMSPEQAVHIAREATIVDCLLGEVVDVDAKLVPADPAPRRRY